MDNSISRRVAQPMPKEMNWSPPVPTSPPICHSHTFPIGQLSDHRGAKWRNLGEAGTGDGQFNQPAGVATDAQGNVGVADPGNNRVQIYNPAARHWTNIGQQGSKAGEFKSPAGVASDSQGQIWVADQDN